MPVLASFARTSSRIRSEHLRSVLMGLFSVSMLAATVDSAQAQSDPDPNSARNRVSRAAALSSPAPQNSETPANGGSNTPIMQNTVSGFAQTEGDPGPYFSAPMGSQHFLGDWGGVQPWLLKRGIHLMAAINEEFAGNFTGGKERAYSDAGQFGIELDIDWDKLAGVRNFWTHTLIVNGHGQSVSRNFGDSIAGVQQIYGARGNVVAHMVAMYGEMSFVHNRIDVSAGWIPVGSFFAASPLFCDFMNVAMCGNPAPNKYTEGNRDWPSGNLGAVVRAMPTMDTYIMAGLFAVSPHSYNGGISGWSWAQSGLGKFSTPVEIGWTPKFGHNQLQGHYVIGYSYDNSRYVNLYEDIHGNSWQLTGQPRRYEAGRNSAWLILDQMLVRNGPGNTNGLIAMAGAMYSDGKTVAMRDHEWAGLVDTGSAWGRPLDTVGAMYQHFDMSHTAALQQESSLALGLPYQDNQWGAVYGPQSHENVYELFYSAHIARAMALQPDFQYIQRPSATTTFHDAAVLGVQFTVVL
ncbi:carbohydrate porin [Gluconobacter oxydans]|uniref:Porin n=2 Tax=Gluconobacter oxydans TaxID=442 RepID=A0AB34XKG7_GLUOY|nr:carbohydrate porin [Gluconobacter oxydans]AHK71421.1 porin B [Gluconobacter oxydans DSM 3504]KXV10716.1 porin [Gluconobacter oxydans]KXV14319.1 porin [Gluconobacter oxydans]MCP1249533.1 carbohydrate porin [Gluconobacter oxydans]